MSVQMLLPLKETPGSLSLPSCTQPRVSACIPVANTTAFNKDGLTLRLCQTGPQRASLLFGSMLLKQWCFTILQCTALGSYTSKKFNATAFPPLKENPKNARSGLPRNQGQLNGRGKNMRPCREGIGPCQL